MKKLSVICSLSILASLIVATLVPLSALAADPEPALLSARGFQLTTTYPSIVAGKGQDITFPLDVISKGKADETISLSVASAPKGWETTIKDRGYGVRTLNLLSGKSQSLTLSVKPSEDAVEGNSKIVLQAATEDGAIKSILDLNVAIEAKPVGGIKLNTIYPQIQGPTTGKFQFKVDVVNDGDQQRTIGLSTAQPQDWQVTIKPSYEDTQISSLAVKNGETKGLDVSITPSPKAEPGEYPVKLEATAGTQKATLDLKVVLAGTYQMSLATDSGRLSTEATAGQPTNVTFQVSNKGSAELRNISFTSSKPDAWDVTFSPDKVDSLAAGATQEVKVTVKPSGKAISGDYLVTLNASSASGGASDKQQLRVTVETSTLWGWAGIILVAIVIAGLGGLFTRLGRR
ncbi:MAG: NEW3 domain-containing protein [Chloroflexi bacterium]|nr:NEW3 domain-containing protein [Chloroflexota bacterium]